MNNEQFAKVITNGDSISLNTINNDVKETALEILNGELLQIAT